MKYPKVCKGCIHLVPVYGNKSKDGTRTISSYFCSKKNGKNTTIIKQCALREEHPLFKK